MSAIQQILGGLTRPAGDGAFQAGGVASKGAATVDGLFQAMLAGGAVADPDPSGGQANAQTGTQTGVQIGGQSGGKGQAAALAAVPPAALEELVQNLAQLARQAAGLIQQANSDNGQAGAGQGQVASADVLLDLATQVGALLGRFDAETGAGSLEALSARLAAGGDAPADLRGIVAMVAEVLDLPPRRLLPDSPAARFAAFTAETPVTPPGQQAVPGTGAPVEPAGDAAPRAEAPAASEITARRPVVPAAATPAATVLRPEMLPAAPRIPTQAAPAATPQSALPVQVAAPPTGTATTSAAAQQVVTTPAPSTPAQPSPVAAAPLAGGGFARGLSQVATAPTKTPAETVVTKLAEPGITQPLPAQQQAIAAQAPAVPAAPLRTLREAVSVRAGEPTATTTKSAAPTGAEVKEAPVTQAPAPQAAAAVSFKAVLTAVMQGGTPLETAQQSPTGDIRMPAEAADLPRTSAEAPAPTGFARSLANQIKGAQFSEGRTRIELAPRGLGEIEIDLAADEAGKLRIVLRAENPAVLQALRGDRDTLLNVLRDSGMSLDAGELSFEEFGERQSRRERTLPEEARRATTAEHDEPETAEPQQQPAQIATADGRLDMIT